MSQENNNIQQNSLTQEEIQETQIINQENSQIKDQNNQDIQKQKNQNQDVEKEELNENKNENENQNDTQKHKNTQDENNEDFQNQKIDNVVIQQEQFDTADTNINFLQNDNDNDKINNIKENNSNQKIDDADQYIEQFKQLEFKQKTVGVLNLLSYLFSRISRALTFDYDTLLLEDFYVDLSTVETTQACFDYMKFNTLSLIFQRLQLYPINNDIKQDKIFLKNNAQIRKILSELDQGYFKEKPARKYSRQTTLQWLQNQQYQTKQENLSEDLFRVNWILKVFIYEYDLLMNAENVHKELSAVGIDTIQPFVGFTGQYDNLIQNFKRQAKNIQDKTYINNDMRGLFATGEKCDTLYIVWHGSCNEYDWYCNLDSPLLPLKRNILPELPRHWVLHQGFTLLINETWNTPQLLNIHGYQTQSAPLFRHALHERMKNKKTAFFTGHSQGASLAALACIYYHYQMQQYSQNIDVRGWFLSLPRYCDKKTAKIIDQLFEVDKGSFKLVRQNVLGDPVPLGFESPHATIQLLKRGCCMTQIIMQDEIFTILYQVLTKKEVIEEITNEIKQEEQQNIEAQINRDSMYHQQYDRDSYQQQQKEQSSGNLFSNISAMLAQSFFEKEVLNPLQNKYNGNFPKFLIDYTDPNSKSFSRTYKKIIWSSMAKRLRKNYFKFLPENLQKTLKITKKDITGKLVRNFIHNTAILMDFSDDKDNDNNLQNLLFESEFEYMNLHKNQILLKNSKNNKKKLKNQKKLKANVDDYDQMGFTKEVLKYVINSRLEKMFHAKELSYLGEMLEGYLYFDSDFGDTGVNLLDKLDNHKDCERTQDLNLVDQIINQYKEAKSQKKQYYQLNSEEFVWENIDKIYVESMLYLAPYHYGGGRYKISFNLDMFNECNLRNMYNFGIEYNQLSEQQQDEMFFSSGLISKNRKAFQQMLNQQKDYKIIQNRIISKINAFGKILDEVIQNPQDQQLEINIMNIVGVFKDLIEETDQNSIEQFNLLVKSSYFLGTFYKSLLFIYQINDNELRLEELNFQELYDQEEQRSQENIESTSDENNIYRNSRGRRDTEIRQEKEKVRQQIHKKIINQIPYQDFINQVFEVYNKKNQEEKVNKQYYFEVHHNFLMKSLQILRNVEY